MYCSPCCCCNLQTGAKTVGILQIVSSIVLCSLFIFGLVVGVHPYSKSNSTDLNPVNLAEQIGPTGKNNDSNAQQKGISMIVNSSIFIFISLINFSIGVMLLQGAHKRDTKRCWIWLFISLFSVSLTIISFIVGCATETITVSIISQIFYILMELYFIWVVYAFILEVQDEASVAIIAQAHLVH